MRGSSPGGLTTEPRPLLPEMRCVWWDGLKMPVVLGSREVIRRDAAESALGPCTVKDKVILSSATCLARVWMHCLIEWGTSNGRETAGESFTEVYNPQVNTEA